MSDLISREAVKNKIGFVNLYFRAHGQEKYLDDLIDEVPTADAIPVVRCRDCEHHEKCHIESLFEDWGIENPYCCIGELEGRKCGIE